MYHLYLPALLIPPYFFYLLLSSVHLQRLEQPPDNAHYAPRHEGNFLRLDGPELNLPLLRFAAESLEVHPAKAQVEPSQPTVLFSSASHQNLDCRGHRLSPHLLPHLALSFLHLSFISLPHHHIYPLIYFYPHFLYKHILHIPLPFLDFYQFSFLSLLLHLLSFLHTLHPFFSLFSLHLSLLSFFLHSPPLTLSHLFFLLSHLLSLWRHCLVRMQQQTDGFVLVLTNRPQALGF